jgi:hypothetical protein
LFLPNKLLGLYKNLIKNSVLQLAAFAKAYFEDRLKNFFDK